MRIIIFGASGGTGRELVKQGLSLGHIIAAFVRNPNSLEVKDEKLTIFQGDVLNAEQVSRAVEGQDVVISVLGNKTSKAIRKSNTVISEGLQNIIAAMDRNNLKRLLFVTSFGVSENVFLPEKLFIKIFLKNIFADIPKQERLIQASGLDWTIVRPARLVNTPKTANYNAGDNLRFGIFSKISRTDVADFLLKSVDKREYFRKIIGLKHA